MTHQFAFQRGSRRRLLLAMIWTAVSCVSLLSAAPSHAGLVATYEFNNTLAADQAGVASLSAVDPLATSGFVNDTVFGHSRAVYAFNGLNSPVTDQGGLSLNTTGLVSTNSYSVQIVFELFDRAGAWRRILDVQNRQSDNGFYVDPSNNLDIFPVAGSSHNFSSSIYHDVVLTVASNNTVNGYLDGTLQFTTSTPVMDINNPSNLMNFFLDNVIGGGQGEWSRGRVALINLYNAPLTVAQADSISGSDPFATVVPEPGTFIVWSLMAGVFGLVWNRQRINQPAMA